MEDQLKSGKIKFFNAQKGFGFITMQDSKEIFFHITNVVEKLEPNEGDDVEFYIGDGKHGPCAEKVRLV